MTWKCAKCGRERADLDQVCPGCGRVEHAPGGKRWLSAPFGLVILTAGVALVMGLVLFGLAAMGWS